jgi:hypothetical protein
MTPSPKQSSSTALWNSRSAFAAVLLIPILALLLWHLRNHGWPNDDAANYMTTAYDISARFHEQGTLSGLAALLNLRGWRPILHPILAVPFLLASRGSVVFAAAGVLWILYLIFCIYTYRLCRLFLPEGKAALASAVVVTSPMLCAFATVFFAEMPWIAFACGWLYHLLRADEFRSARHAALAGLFLGLMLTTRPAESVAITAILIVYMVARAYRNKAIHLPDIWVTCVLLSASGGLLLRSLFVASANRWVIWLVFGLTALAAMILARRKPQTVSGGHAAFWVAVGAVCVVWWAGFVKPLYEWAYMTSFGQMAKITAPPQHQHASIANMVIEICKEYGAAQIGSLMAIACLLLVSRWIQLKMRRGVPVVKQGGAASVDAWPLVPLLVAALGALLPVFALYWSSGTGDPRRAMVGIVFLLLLLAVTILRGSGIATGTAAVFVFAIATFQTYMLLTGVFGLPAPHSRMMQWLGPAMPYPSPAPDGNEVMAKILAAKVPVGSTVAVYTMALFSAANRVYEPAALTLGARMQNRSLAIGYLWDEGDYNTVIRRLGEQGYQYLLLDRWDSPEVRRSHMPYVHFAARLLDTLQQDGAAPGLQVIDTFSVNGRPQLLFRLSSAKVPVAAEWITPSENLAAARNGARAIATSHQTGYEIAALNDGTDKAWGTAEGLSDSFAAVVLPQSKPVRQLRIVLFTPAGRAHLRDISVVAADGEGPDGPKWSAVRARLEGQTVFSDKITIPALPDNSTVNIEVDPQDNSGPHRIWGFACFSGTRGYTRNYLVEGTGIYVRELQMR